MVNQPTRILIVDDDAGLRAMLRRALEHEFDILEAEDGASALRLLQQHRPGLVLLDAMMPGLDGFGVLRKIRELTATPVVMLTAIGDEADVVRALDLGADDFVAKPFSPRALAARLRAVLRRAAPPTAALKPEPLQLYDGDLVIDEAAARVWAQGSEVSLSATEYRLLVCLANHRGQVLAPSQILQQVWGPGYDGESGYVKTYVRLLRSKIEPEPTSPRYVLSRRGLGYLLAAGA
jgi:two-component system KDP operon response regulator KdpE